ncbi:hypothetical protein [Polycladidibacter hongkongensis]|uniref:hypothetical protein n=1 Tax=Polycladidibacter hongkongensis TaxID=1647556 RepID=UPI000835F679|nr:hypothetical protein [Pseudovibrio hongkongensis]
MNTNEYAVILSTLSGRQPQSIDSLLAPFDNRLAPEAGNCLASEGMAPSESLFAQDTQLAIAFMVSKPLENINATALKLASIAAEKNTIPVIFSKIDYCGLEQAGFRIERISNMGDEEANLQIEQLQNLWGTPFIIELQ